MNGKKSCFQNKTSLGIRFQRINCIPRNQMGRLAKQIHFERVQVYLLPDEVRKLKIEAHNKNVNVSRYIRNIIINTFRFQQKDIA
jgi:hypothetical protein